MSYLPWDQVRQAVVVVDKTALTGTKVLMDRQTTEAQGSFGQLENETRWTEEKSDEKLQTKKKRGSR
ncbi:hypothetical protein CTA1_9012 [Colletotrichum tanaceti]|uniref:Uncharacterized protein n=1 Tax=Colletotrichum tanaceti TaxID=1306861 RepID=A0A4U6X8A4_9PEZI|nr:hypothetical protein CTA1_9012 [Colletotrichum tanaceti]